MKKTLKKAIALLLAMLSLGTVLLCGCGTPPPDENRFDEEVDTTRTQLYVGYFNGGMGLPWLTEVKKRFEALYPEYQIMIDTGLTEYQSEVLEANMKTNRQDMYIVDTLNYYSLANKGLLMDVTDAMTTPLTEFGEDRSIADKMNDTLNEYYRTNQGKYFGTPFYQAYHHIIYDADLFDEYNLWYKDGGGFVSSKDDKKSAGQDGVYGNWDDGLPVTYSEFFALCDRMVARGITPITWSGTYADSYLPNFMASVIADYEGENFRTNFSFEGKLNVFKNYNFTEPGKNTFVLNPDDYKTVTVNNDNYQDYIPMSVGKYFAAKFAKDLASNPAYRTYNYAESHTGVQRSYLLSNMDGVNNPIAMLIEGHWWYNESKSVFNEMAGYDEKYSQMNRRFGVMPLPKADDGSSAEGHTVSPFSGDSAIFISNFSSKKDLAVKFYRFLHTEEALQICTKYSYITRPYDYDMESLYNEVPYYVRTSMEATADTTFIYRVPVTGQYKENPEVTSFMQYGAFMYSSQKDYSGYNMLIHFCDHSGKTAKDYFVGLKAGFDLQLPSYMKK